MQESIQSMDTLIVEVRDQDGNIKPVFQENKFFLFLISKGIVSPKFPKIPYLLGRWQNYKEITKWV
jgi:hypothetical protein